MMTSVVTRSSGYKEDCIWYPMLVMTSEHVGVMAQNYGMRKMTITYSVKTQQRTNRSRFIKGGNILRVCFLAISGVLSYWVKCSNGNVYHPFVKARKYLDMNVR